MPFRRAQVMDGEDTNAPSSNNQILSESVLNTLTLFEKTVTLYFQSLKFVSRPGFQCPGMFVQK